MVSHADSKTRSMCPKSTLRSFNTDITSRMMPLASCRSICMLLNVLLIGFFCEGGRNVYKIAVMTYKLKIHQQPLYLHEYTNDNVSVRILCSLDRALLRVPSTKTATAVRALATTTLWNNPPNAVKNSTTSYQFCHLLIGNLFSHAFG